MGFPSFYEGRRWAMPAVPELAQTMGTFYEKPDAYSVDGAGSRTTTRTARPSTWAPDSTT